MAQLSSEERIKRVEQAPVEVQTMVAKAYLRDDIDDEDVQYLFNTDTIEQINDTEENSGIENINAEEPEGIGAVGFVMRTTKPSGNKNFITTGSGGWNTCIKGYPMDAGANVLANCVGYASGRFNEIINEIRGTTGCTYKTLNCNAIGFKERAEAAGLKTGSTPKRGAIMCWGNASAGHVAIVERVDSNNQVYTSESGYGSTAFWNQTRTNSNGRWGCSGNYYFRCFIYLPDDVQKIVDGGSAPTPTPTPAPNPSPNEKFNIGDTVVISGPLYVSSNAATAAGKVSSKVTTITKKNPGSAHPYNTTGDLGWMDESSITKYVAPTPAPLAVGNTVKIIGTGNGNSMGGGQTAYGIGWTRQILKIWNGRPYPYQVGNSSGTTGFYKAEALQRK